MTWITVVFVAVSLVVMAFGIPVFVAFGAGSVLHELLRTGNPAPSLFSSTMTFGVSSLTLMAIPLFLYVGKLMNETGLTHVLFAFANQCVGAIRGGLGQVNVFLSMVFAGMSGSEVADIVGIGTIEMKAMKAAGYDQRYSAGITLSSSLVGPIIPPSISAILYAILADISVTDLLIGLLVPGVLMGVLLMAMVYAMAVLHPDKFPPTREIISLRSWWRSLLAALPCLFTPIILVGGIASGVFTATESAAFAGVWLTIVAALWYRCLDLPLLWRVLKQTAIDSSVIMIILGAATLWMWILTRARVPYVVGEWAAAATTDPLVFMAIVGILLLFVGCFTSVSVAINILVPILAPVALVFEIDPLHFAAFFICVLNVGNVTPPFGLGLFALQKVTGMAFTDLVVGMLPFLLPMFLVMLLVAFFPAISTWLPAALF
jgi:tripartite ATP-independent transporter DctM subunit